jgi:hypothetical protein
MKLIIKKESKIYTIIDEDTGDEYGTETSIEGARKLLKYLNFLFFTDTRPHDSFCNSDLKRFMDEPEKEKEGKKKKKIKV